MHPALLSAARRSLSDAGELFALRVNASEVETVRARVGKVRHSVRAHAIRELDPLRWVLDVPVLAKLVEDPHAAIPNAQLMGAIATRGPWQ